MSQHSPQATTDSRFDQDVIQAETLTLVDFWADWCGPCKAIAPVLDQLAEDYGERLSIRKLDADKNPQAVADYGIRSIPSLLLFKQGKVVASLIGLQSKTKLTAAIEQHISQ